jgi:hypothetical protein
MFICNLKYKKINDIRMPPFSMDALATETICLDNKAIDGTYLRA